LLVAPEGDSGGARATTSAMRSPRRMNLFGGVRATVTSPPK
jgi:hypothetical protein